MYSSKHYRWRRLLLLACSLLVTALGFKLYKDFWLDEPLISKAAAGDINGVQSLISRGASVNAIADDGGYTSLMYAAWNGHTAIVKVLLAAGADVNVKNHLGVTALQLAESYNHTDIVDLLKKAGAKE